MDIEEVAHKSPEKIITVKVDARVGIQSFQCNEVGMAIGLDISLLKKFSSILFSLYKLFVEKRSFTD